MFLKKGRVAARKRIHRQILLRADESEGHTGWTDVAVAEAYGISIRTVERVRQRFIEHGLKAALQPRAPQENHARKFDGEKEAKLLTLACSKAPEGYARWTLQLLADKMVELKYMKNVSDETVRMDNPNTHTGALFYETFPPEEARRLLDKLEIRYTPKHGSRLNIAEIGLSMLSGQCLHRRVPDMETLTHEVAVTAHTFQ